MNRTCLLVSLVATVLLASNLPAAEWTFRRGDCNGDSGYDISDPIFLLAELFAGGTPVPCKDACDANDDGLKNLADAVTMLNSLFGMGGPLPDPFTACGIDPTFDTLDCAAQVSGCPGAPPQGLDLLEPPGLYPAQPTGYNNQLARPGQLDNLPLNSTFLHSGEFLHQVTDMSFAGRGIDFSWKRTYRSRQDSDGPLGSNWTHSYQILIEECPGGVLLHGGDGRRDFLAQQPDGTYSSPGLFLQAVPSIIGFGLTVRFGGGGSWSFHAIDGSPTSGKIETIADRNGNTIYCTYDALGRLTTVTDPLGHIVAIGYDASDRIATLTDHTARVVTYDYYAVGESGGSPTDLKRVTSPAVTGTPNGNDYPSGKTVTYTYSTGFSDERLNHNLLTITDPKGQTFLENTYSSSTNPADFEFDRLSQQQWGDDGGIDITDIIYSIEVPTVGNGNASTRAIVNDRVGIVREYFYDASNRLVQLHEYTGFATANLPTTLTTNRPGAPLRATDPTFFETRYEWNAQHLPQLLTTPNGTTTSFTYQLDLNPAASPLESGNLRQRVRQPGTHPVVGDQSQLMELWTYEPGFGGHYCSDFVATHTDARGNTTTHSYDGSGNRTQTIHRDSGIVENFEYNTFGQRTARVWPSRDNTTTPSSRRRDEMTYYTTGPQTGYMETLREDALGLELITTFEYDARGNLTSQTDPKGNKTEFVVNQLNQVVEQTSGAPDPTSSTFPDYRQIFYYDANDNLARRCVDKVNELGVLDPIDEYITMIYEYDELNRLIRTCREYGSFDVPMTQIDCTGLSDSHFIKTEYGYDANGNRTEIRFGAATSGVDALQVINFVFDERDLVFTEVRGGTGESTTTRWSYDGNRNCTKLETGTEDPTPRVHTFTYDAYDRIVEYNDPLDNVTSVHYDANSNRTSEQIDGELNDIPGASANMRLHEANFVFDVMDRATTRQVQHFVTATQAPIGDGVATTTTVFNGLSQALSVTDDNSRTTTYTYDSLNRLATRTDPAGNSISYGYDSNSNVTQRTHVEVPTAGPLSPQTLVDTFTYDGVDRLKTTTDNAGNTQTYSYDSRNNLVRHVDGRGNVHRYEYDARDRLIATHHDMTNTGSGTGTVLSTTTTTSAYDASNRLISRTDPNGNATTYEYDALNRLTRTTHPDTTQTNYAYDAHGNLTSETDANGTATAYMYDRLNRKTGRALTPAPGVSPQTTFESYEYDGLSRMTRGANNDSALTFTYDSLSNALTEQRLGQTTSRTYDGVGNMLTCAYPSGRLVTNTYGPLDRRATVESPAGSSIAQFVYMGPHREIGRLYGNGTSVAFGYDNLRRVNRTTQIQGSIPLADHQYSWDADSNKESRMQLVGPTPSTTHNYQYDSLGRLTSTDVTDPVGSPLRNTSYTYDAVGNRTSVVDSICAGTYMMSSATPPADFVMNQYTQTGCDTREYDDAGNLIVLTTASNTNYQYDALDRLVTVIDGPVTSTFKYDVLGRRISKTVTNPTGGMQETQYFYDGAHVIEEQETPGSVVRTFVYGDRVDQVLSMQQPGPTAPADFYYHPDDLGSVLLLTDAAGFVAESYEYDDFGAPKIFDAVGTSLSSPQLGNPYLFHGRRYDTETGFYYYRNRYLDPAAGRFTSRDPLGVWGDPSGFGCGTTFVGNNPTSALDPFGLAKEKFVRDKPHVNIGTIGGSAMPQTREHILLGRQVGVPMATREHILLARQVGTMPQASNSPKAIRAKCFTSHFVWDPDPEPQAMNKKEMAEKLAKKADLSQHSQTLQWLMHGIGLRMNKNDLIDAIAKSSAVPAPRKKKKAYEVVVVGSKAKPSRNEFDDVGLIQIAPEPANQSNTPGTRVRKGMQELKNLASHANSSSSDGVVDAADFAVWRSNYGSTAGGGVVDADDYGVWRHSSGNSATGDLSIAPLPPVPQASKKTREIVVVGSKVKDVIRPEK